jgi:hypothetical protein
MEFIHSPLYGVALKSCQKFVAKTVNSPILTMVYHRADGSLFACDRHRAFLMKEAHGFKEDMMISPFSFEAARGEYPDIEKVAASVCEKTLTIERSQVAAWLQMHKSFNQYNKKLNVGSNIGNITFSDSGVQIEVGDHIDMKVKVQLPFQEYKKPDELMTIYYNVEFMRDALQAHHDLGSNQILISVGGRMQPIHLDNEKGTLKTLILPYRNGGSK